MEFWEALELNGGIPLGDDLHPDAVMLTRQLDKINATLAAYNAAGPGRRRGASEELGELMIALPPLLWAYYKMRLGRTFNKRAVKKGLSSSVVYSNLFILVIFARVAVPRLLAANTVDELFDAAGAVGIPDRATLGSYLGNLERFDPVLKVACFTLAFIVEKVFMVTEFLPIQIGLKTVSPLIFGGVVQGALAAGFCETLAAATNFAIGKFFLAQRVSDFSLFGGEPWGKAKWFAKISKAAEQDGFKLALLLRLAPVLPLPFDSYWYLLGALPVKFLEFFAGHFIGCLKTCFLDASFGQLLLATVAPDNELVKSQAQSIVAAETFAFAVVAVLVSTVATRLINEVLELDTEEEEPEPEVFDPIGGLATVGDAPLVVKPAEPVVARRAD